MKYDYIVIGGGIIGMTTAREIATQGASVAILDRQKFGNEASRVAGGILSSMQPWNENPDSTFLSEKAKILYPNFILNLQEETDINTELIKSGLIIINKEHSEKTKKWSNKNKITLIDKINKNYPEINIPDYSILLPEIYQVRPPLLLNALYKSLKILSVDLFENSRISHIEVKNNKFEYVKLNNDKKLHAHNLIITTGAWSDLFLKNINSTVNIKPIRGQIVCVQANNNTIDKIILDGGHYLIPRLDGQILIGSTMEDVGFINNITEIVKEELLDWAYSIAPQLVDEKLIGHWTGLRPAIDNGKPVIGIIPNFKNIYINAGHFRKGILQAPASAKLLTDHLFKKASFMDITKFTLENRKNITEPA